MQSHSEVLGIRSPTWTSRRDTNQLVTVASRHPIRLPASRNFIIQEERKWQLSNETLNFPVPLPSSLQLGVLYDPWQVTERSEVCPRIWAHLMFPHVDENSINWQVKKKKGNFIWAKLRVVTKETDSQKLWELFHLLEVKGTVIHFRDKVSYVKMTYWYLTLSSPRNIVQVNR